MLDKQKILIVEDEIMLAQSLKRIVEEKYTVCGIAADYTMAELLFNELQPDAVLIDITLDGEKNGLDFAAYIRSNSNVPFIILTAHSEPDVLEKIVDLAPQNYMVKPVQKVNLMTALQLIFSQKEFQTVFITVGAQKHKFCLHEILYVVSEHVYLKIYLKNGKSLLLRISLQNFLKQCPAGSLLRVNRSEAVNPVHINHQTRTVVFIGDRNFKISSKFQKK